MEQSITSDGRYAPNINRRPSLLSVLCVLTWLTSLYMFFLKGVPYILPESTAGAAGAEDQVTRAFAEIQTNNPEIAERVQHYMDAAFEYLQITGNNLILLGIVIMLVAAASFTGAMWMWRLRKSGFYIYLAAKIAGIAVPLIVYGGNVISLIICGLAIFVGGIVVLLYALNLKYMY